MFFSTGVPPTPSDLQSMSGAVSPNSDTVAIFRHTHLFLVELYEQLPPAGFDEADTPPA